MVRSRREALGLRLAAAFVAMVAALLVFSASAFAVTLPVNNTNDGLPAPAGSLRAAIEAANSDPDRDVIDATGVRGTISLGAVLPALSQDVHIRGPGAQALTVRRGMNVMSSFGIFTIGIGTVAEISGLTIASGNVVGIADGGAGVYNDRGTLTLRASVVTRNVAGASLEGGGIYNFSPSPAPAATMRIVDSSVTGNVSGGSGGGILNTSFSRLTIRRSTVSGNTSQGGAGCVGGGGVRNSGFLTVANSTVAGNSADTGGGILSCATTPNTTSIANSTIASNSSPFGGANLGIVTNNVPGDVALRSTILADARGGAEDSCTIAPEVPSTSRGYNLADDASCRLNRPTDQPGTEPQLGPLANHGGPTPTMALPLSSPAVDKGIGDALTIDQRGRTRPVEIDDIPNAAGGDGTDIGAFELQAPPEPSNEFSFGKVRKNKRKGTAKLTVIVPGSGEVALAGKKVKPVTEQVGATAAGASPDDIDVVLKVKAKAKGKRKLKRTGKAKVKAKVTYTPDGGEPNTQDKRLKLKKRR